MKARFASILLLITCPAVSASVDVLEFLPNCQQIEPIVLTANRSVGKGKMPEDLSGVPEFAQILEELTHQAEQQGRDAIYLTQLYIRQRFNGPHSGTKQPTLVGQHLHVSVNAIQYCPDDRSLSEKPSPLTAQGKRRLVYTQQITLAIPSETEPEGLAAFHPHIHPNRALGVLEPGMSGLEIVRLLGKPSLMLQATHDRSIWSYGRTYWLYLEDGQLSALSNKGPALSGELRNEIPLLSPFDDHGWDIEEKVGRHATWQEVREALPHFAFDPDLRRASVGEQLQLIFEPFHDQAKYLPVDKLTQFILTKPGAAAQPLFNPTQAYDKQISQQLLSSALSGQLQTKAQLVQAYPMAHWLEKGKGRSSMFIGNHLQLRFEGANLHSIQLHDALFPQSDTNHFERLLESVAVPLDKGAMLSQYPEAVDLADSVSLDLAHYTTEVIYDGESSEAKPYLVSFMIF
ncbi:hypothetical protein [Ferrimonas marina]|uniref:Uncharacterized protein n=1 Tax=Ferrimonas marina TaxID=299255 RepID=A0A1M5P375_9GAMM|nr:hypothetical protein [Ferrimonas marina]SHG96261.1 hypothetical protein SAMN02745129_1274 [Ferrimonas marina]